MFSQPLRAQIAMSIPSSSTDIICLRDFCPSWVEKQLSDMLPMSQPVPLCTLEPRVLQSSSKRSRTRPEMDHMAQSAFSGFLTHAVEGHDPPAPQGSWVRISTSGSYCFCQMMSAEVTKQRITVRKMVLQRVRVLRTSKLSMRDDGAKAMGHPFFKIFLWSTILPWFKEQYK